MDHGAVGRPVSGERDVHDLRKPSACGRSLTCRPLMTRVSGSISVVVPTFNRCRKLIRLLDSLDKLEGDYLKEVIVVDDSSKDDTPRAILGWIERHQGFALTYLRMEVNAGPAIARNIGMREATGELVAFTDDDCVAHPQWLVNLVRPLNVEKNIIGVGGAVLPMSGHVIARYYTFHHILEPAPSMLYLVTANCCYVRDLALEAGGFDADLPMPGGEDVALSFRLYKRGYRFVMACDAVVYHDYRKGIRDFYRTFVNYGKGCRYVTKKYFGSGGTAA